MCPQDDEGAFVLAKTLCVTPLCTMDVGEALSLFHAFQWISDMQFDNVDFVLDSKTTTDAFHMNRVDVIEFCHVIYNCSCKKKLPLNLQTLRLSLIGDN